MTRDRLSLSLNHGGGRRLSTKLGEQGFDASKAETFKPGALFRQIKE